MELYGQGVGRIFRLTSPVSVCFLKHRAFFLPHLRSACPLFQTRKLPVLGKKKIPLQRQGKILSWTQRVLNRVKPVFFHCKASGGSKHATAIAQGNGTFCRPESCIHGERFGYGTEGVGVMALQQCFVTSFMIFGALLKAPSAGITISHVPQIKQGRKF